MLWFYLSLLPDPDDKERFERFYLEVHQKMLHYAFNILKNDADAEEALQDSFTKLAIHFERCSKFTHDQLCAYFTVIVRNQALNRYKVNQRQRDHEISEEEIEKHPELHLEDSVLQEICNKVDYEFLVCMIKGLNERYRDVLLLHLVYEMNFEDISKNLGRPLKTVRQQWLRGKSKLCHAMKGSGQYETNYCS